MRKGEDAISDQTANLYLAACKQFCRWMKTDRRANGNPLDHLQAIKVNKSDEMKRRSLEPDEIIKLLRTMEIEPKRFGMTGPERSLLYQLAIESGLRSKPHATFGHKFDYVQI